MHTIKRIVREGSIAAASVLVAFSLFMGAALVFAAWSNPTQDPPRGNVPEPVNIGANWQEKEGPLAVYDLWLTEWPYQGTQYVTGTWAGGSLIDLQTNWQLLAKGSDYTEEALITLASSTMRAVTDSQFLQYNVQSVNLGGVNWPKNPDLVSEIMFFVKNDFNDYCAGGDGILNLTSGPNNRPTKCYVLRRLGSAATFQSITTTGATDDWIRLDINGQPKTACNDALNIGNPNGYSRYGSQYGGTVCYYQQGSDWIGDVNLLQIEEADGSLGFGSWDWEIWYRYFDKTTQTPGGDSSGRAWGWRSGGSFLPGTKVITPYGAKNIEELREGDAIVGFDEKSGKVAVSRVLTPRSHMSSEYYVVNGAIRVTGTHPFAVKKDNTIAWKKVNELAVGDMMVGSGGTLVPVISILKKDIAAPVTVYNPGMSYPHTYFAVGADGIPVLVHNKYPVTESHE